MEEIKNFIHEFLSAEALALDASTKPDLKDYNSKLVSMNNFCIKELYNKFGMIPLTELEDDDFYEEWKDAEPVKLRNIFKISRYKDDVYDDIYIGYISPSNPNGRVFRYGECIFVTKIGVELKVVKNYTFGDSMRIKKKFETGQGLENISFETLHNPIEIERYMPPTHDKDAMEHYLADI